MHDVGRLIGCALTGVAVAGWCGAVPATASAASAASAHSAETVTFQYTGGPQTLTIPSWASHATFTVYGARGGGFGTSRPGYGGVTEADIPVSGGERIIIVAGGAGSGPRCLPQTVVPNPGGFNGGGAGGYQATSENKNNCSGGSGGGATDVRIGGDSLADRVLVASDGDGAALGGSFTVWLVGQPRRVR